MNIPEEVTFEGSQALTQSLLTQIEAGEISQPEAGEAIASLVKTENGARGFFVVYLTSEGSLADNPSPEIIQALQASPDTVAELLVKNLAMSAAMAFIHRRDGNQEMARGSDRVKSRTISLIQKAELPQVTELAAQLRESALTGEGTYKTFLQRWQYNAEQREIISQVLVDILPTPQAEES
ncbi:MAG: hypothetical protein WA919_15555 [Coleofasciculaceae cyanobacterium]